MFNVMLDESSQFCFHTLYLLADWLIGSDTAVNHTISLVVDLVIFQKFNADEVYIGDCGSCAVPVRHYGHRDRQHCTTIFTGNTVYCSHFIYREVQDDQRLNVQK